MHLLYAVENARNAKRNPSIRRTVRLIDTLSINLYTHVLFLFYP